MEILVSDLSDKHHNMPAPPVHSQSSSTASSAPTSPPLTPSFEPNSHADGINPSKVTVPSLIASLQSDLDKSPKERLESLNIPELDFTQPISSLLKIGTQRAHVQAENSEGAAALVKGDLDLEEYIRWLAVLWRVYDALELGLSEYATNSVLAPTYDPAVLARADSLARDISYLLTLLPTASSSSASSTNPEGPLPPFALPEFLAPVFTDTPPQLAAYLSHLRSLSSSSSSAPGLLAHSYVRYLGDLSGGQFIAVRIKKAYDLTGPDGLRFYHFNLQSKEGIDDESRADVRRRVAEVKDWFRKGMDEGVGEDEDLKATLIREANLAFALNTHLFSLIRPPTAAPTANGGQQLRYYEKRELERKEKEARLLTQGKGGNNLRDQIERGALFGATVLIGLGFSRYVLPYLTDYFNQQTGGHKEL